MRRLALGAAFVLAGCGGDSGDGAPPAAAPAEPPGAAEVPRVCEAIPTGAASAALRRPPGALIATGDAALGLVSCEWRERSGPEAFAGVSIDTAPKTARRFYNLIAEARQIATFDATQRSLSPRDVRGVGNDATHGGVGAFWIPARSQLNALAGGRLVKVTVSGDAPRVVRLAGRSDRARAQRACRPPGRQAQGWVEAA